ncbi:MAG: hypothetical protein WAK00_06865 [Microbacterium sp.]|uniref:hypothetical protein n=1 Tax=Microbacterium sp. TaxID=51671 RepID=UPI003BB04753
MRADLHPRRGGLVNSEGKRRCTHLHRAWPEAEFVIVEAGHSASEPAIQQALRDATDLLAL